MFRTTKEVRRTMRASMLTASGCSHKTHIKSCHATREGLHLVCEYVRSFRGTAINRSLGWKPGRTCPGMGTGSPRQGAEADDNLMARKLLVVAAAAAVALAGFYALRWSGRSDSAVAQAPQGPRPVSVEVAIAAKKDMPVLLEGIGNVTTIASVAVDSRLDNEIVEVHFAD